MCLDKCMTGLSRSHLQVGHIFVALFGTGVVRQLDVPEARQLMNQERVLFDHCVKDILQTQNHIRYDIPTQKTPTYLGCPFFNLLKEMCLPECFKCGTNAYLKT